MKEASFTHATNGTRFTQLERQRLTQMRYAFCAAEGGASRHDVLWRDDRVPEWNDARPLRGQKWVCQRYLTGLDIGEVASSGLGSGEHQSDLRSECVRDNRPPTTLAEVLPAHAVSVSRRAPR
jgi:hypothetical protein